MSIPLSVIIEPGKDPDIQDLAYAIKAYHDAGKLGFYCETLKPFDAWG